MYNLKDSKNNHNCIIVKDTFAVLYYQVKIIQ